MVHVRSKVRHRHRVNAGPQLCRIEQCRRNSQSAVFAAALIFAEATGIDLRTGGRA